MRSLVFWIVFGIALFACACAYGQCPGGKCPVPPARTAHTLEIKKGEPVRNLIRREVRWIKHRRAHRWQ